MRHTRTTAAKGTLLPRVSLGMSSERTFELTIGSSAGHSFASEFFSKFVRGIVEELQLCLIISFSIFQGGSQRLPRLIGVSKAKEMIFTGKMINGTEAVEIGLAEYGVLQNDNGDAAYQRALKLAEEILPRGPIAVRMAKLAINKGMEVY